MPVFTENITILFFWKSIKRFLHLITEFQEHFDLSFDTYREAEQILGWQIIISLTFRRRSARRGFLAVVLRGIFAVRTYKFCPQKRHQLQVSPLITIAVIRFHLYIGCRRMRNHSMQILFGSFLELGHILFNN